MGKIRKHTYLTSIIFAGAVACVSHAPSMENNHDCFLPPIAHDNIDLRLPTKNMQKTLA